MQKSPTCKKRWNGKLRIEWQGPYKANSTTELSDLLINGHKRNIYQVQNTLFTNQSGICNCHKMVNCEQFRTKCCVKIVATLTLASTKCAKNVTTGGV